VKEKINLWRLHNVAEAYGSRPSQIVNLKTALGAWQFDEVCLVICRQFENAINKGENPFKQDSQQGYAPVPKHAIKKIKIPENGVW
jgi:hypothetical protein